MRRSGVRIPEAAPSFALRKPRKKCIVNLARPLTQRPLLFVIGSADIGGAEKQLMRLARELKSRGANVEVAFTQRGGPLISELDSAHIPWRIFPIRLHQDRPKSLVAIVRFCIYLVLRRPRLVNAWLPESAVIALPLVRIFLPKCPRVASVRGNPLVNVGLFKIIYRTVLRSSDRILLNADHLANIVVDEFGISTKRVEVILNGVDIPPTKSDVDVEPPTAVVVANFHNYKGHQILLEALAKVSTPLKVRLCGKGMGLTEIAQAIDSLQLKSVVSIVDGPADISSELRQAQFAIHPSLTEGLSNAILEELASGLPVIAFDIEGNLPIIHHGFNGLLVKSGDIDQLAASIELLASDVSVRRTLSDGARLKVQEYGWESCVGKYEKAFAHLIQRTKSSAK
jgi:glycosyltransferase involved in cell wall biosynthesis